MSPAVEQIVTTPSELKITFNEGNHRYRLAARGEKLMYVPSVTTILGATLPKNLSGWAERKAVEGVLEVLKSEGVEAYPPETWSVEELLELMRQYNLRHWQRRDQAALRGVSVHRAFETLAEGTIPKLSQFPLTERDYLRGLFHWWSEHEPEVDHVELMVGSAAHGYAGRMDLVARVDGRRGIIDLKTSKAIYESHHFQVRGYEIGMAESGYGTVDFAAVLQVSDQGEYQFVETWATKPQFLALFHAYQAQKAFERATPPEHKKERKAA